MASQPPTPPNRYTPFQHNRNYSQAWWAGHRKTFNAVKGALGARNLTESTRQVLREIIATEDIVGLRSLEDRDEKTRTSFLQRMERTRRCPMNIYYRKMGQAEYQALLARPAAPLSAAIDYVGTANYRVWLSSSLEMCRSFFNENATGAGDVIVRFILNGRPLLSAMQCRPHQDSGVQHTPGVVAVHRETFAHIGAFTADDLVEVTAGALDHNIGLTAANAPAFHAMLHSMKAM